MQYNLKLLFFTTLLLCIIACTSNQSRIPEKAEEESFLFSEEFENFYDKFHSDAFYQLEHISFPLEGNSYTEDSEVEMTKWTKSNWKIHKPFDDLGGTFQRSFSSFGDIVTEVISDQNKISSMERRFAKVQGEWNLIYYDPIHLHQ